MFPDSKIASAMDFSRNMFKFIVNIGLAPHLKHILKIEIAASENFSILLDESLNKRVQECEMDLVICFWNSATNKVHVCFWNSMFFGHSTARDL